MNNPVQKTALDIIGLLAMNANSVFGATMEAEPNILCSSSIEKGKKLNSHH
jgi:hypothetical protein